MKNVMSVCACADPWCREHGCRLATQQRYGPQTNYAPVLTALPLPVAAAVAKERAAVVAWLRGEPERLVACDGHRHADGKPCFVLSPMPADELADAIERGEHRREEER